MNGWLVLACNGCQLLSVLPPSIAFLLPELSLRLTLRSAGSNRCCSAQLMSVLPPSAANLLPEPYQPLLLPGSPLADFYPTQFRLDCNGNRVSNKRIALLPFVELSRLVEATVSSSASASEAVHKQRC